MKDPLTCFNYVHQPDVCWSDDPLPCQLPHMELVHSQHTINIEQLLLDAINLVTQKTIQISPDNK